MKVRSLDFASRTSYPNELIGGILWIMRGLISEWYEGTKLSVKK